MKSDCEKCLDQWKDAVFRERQQQYGEKIAKAYLQQLRGYEEATAILKNRYVFALLAKAVETERFEQSFRDMEKKTNTIRREIFQALRSIENQRSMTVLWMFYIEGKQLDEISEQLCLPEWKVEMLRHDGLRKLPVPQEYVNIYMRRHSL